MAGLHVVEEEMPVWDVNSTNQEEEEHPASRRFVRVSEQDVDKIIEEQENENTKRKTAYDISLVVKFMSEEQKEKRELENISPEELNNYLSKFIVAARTKHGKEYEPTSLRGILSSVERYLGRKNYGKRIFIDAEFKKLRETLKAKQKQLKKKGLGNKPRATTALTEGEIEILFEKKILGTSSPQALLNLVWLNNIMHFGLRGCKEQRYLKWGDVILKADSEGKEYLEYSERQTKTRTGEDPRNVRQVNPRMYENKAAVVSERDPLHVYKEYLRNNRPESMMEPETPFYLSVNYFKTASFNCVWFKSQPMGINKLNTIMKEMCKAAGIAQKTNHCGRKTMVQKLQDNGVPPNQ